MTCTTSIETEAGRYEREGRRKNPIACALMRSLGVRREPPPADVLSFQAKLLNAPRGIVDDGPPPWRRERMAVLEGERMERIYARRRAKFAQVAVSVLALAVASVVAAAPAHASWITDGPTAHYSARSNTPAADARRFVRHVARFIAHLSPACQEAARLGGPCGCFASEQVYGHSVRKLWLARAWLRFPRTSAHVGAIAVFIGRHGGAYHVALVDGVDNRGTILRDSWATHRAASGSLIVYVDPHAANVASRE